MITKKIFLTLLPVTIPGVLPFVSTFILSSTYADLSMLFYPTVSDSVHL